MQHRKDAFSSLFFALQPPLGPLAIEPCGRSDEGSRLVNQGGFSLPFWVSLRQPARRVSLPGRRRGGGGVVVGWVEHRRTNRWGGPGRLLLWTSLNGQAMRCRRSAQPVLYVQ